jgi:putative FmdB family regulatory protein
MNGRLPVCGMPLYEYKCLSCGETFEVLQRFSDAQLKVHERCGGPVERIISPSALQFKGTGWYVTDYASGNGKKQAAKDAKDNKDAKDSKKDSSSSASGDSATKADTKTSSATPAVSSDKSEKSSKSDKKV